VAVRLGLWEFTVIIITDCLPEPGVEVSFSTQGPSEAGSVDINVEHD
jgi:hypothetical protein